MERPRQSAFTLVEMLVSVAVLALMVVMVSQLTNSAATTVGNSGKHMDADTEARLLFNRMAYETQKMVKRQDVDYSTFKQPASTYLTVYGGGAQPANLQNNQNDQFAFYSETNGYFTSNTISGSDKAPVSLIAYKVDNQLYPAGSVPVLWRLGKGLGWEPNNASGGWENMVYLPMTFDKRWPKGKLFDTTDPSYQTISPQVFRFEYTYLLKATASKAARFSITPWDTAATAPAHTSINGFKDVNAIVVAIALLDSTSRVIVRDYTNLINAFPDAVDNKDIESQWLPVLNSPSFATVAKIPQTAASAVRVYQRTFYLDSPQ